MSFFDEAFLELAKTKEAQLDEANKTGDVDKRLNALNSLLSFYATYVDDNKLGKEIYEMLSFKVTPPNYEIKYSPSLELYKWISPSSRYRVPQFEIHNDHHSHQMILEYLNEQRKEKVRNHINDLYRVLAKVRRFLQRKGLMSEI